MKIARMLVVVALVVCTGQVVHGQDGHAGHSHGGNAGHVNTGQAGPAGRNLSQAEQIQVKRDQLRIAVQEICPMTGEKLGSMGAPIKVKVGQETVFLCCQGCLKDKINPQHWATIHANIAKAQRICPVMKNGLPKNPKWTFVDGQIVYICCPGCDKDIVADPKAYLRQVDELYAATLQARRVRR
jgi:hypothetical protein